MAVNLVFKTPPFLQLRNTPSNMRGSLYILASVNDVFKARVLTRGLKACSSLITDGVAKNSCEAKSERNRYSIVMMFTASF
ncbi:uncharacterized protein LOC144650672 isoform X2 [Oculina patagonica]